MQSITPKGTGHLVPRAAIDDGPTTAIDPAEIDRKQAYP